MSVDVRARDATNDVLDAVDRMRRSQAEQAAHPGAIQRFRAFEARRRRTQQAMVVVVAIAIAALGFAGLLRAFRSQPVPADQITPDNVDRLRVAWVGSPPRADGAVVGEGYVVTYTWGGDIAAFREDCASDGGRCDPLWTADVTSGEWAPALATEPVMAGGHVLAAGDRCWDAGEYGECATDTYAFPLDCRTDGRVCPPRWVAPEAGGVLMMGSIATDGRLVYVSGNQLDVYRFDCGEAGATCEKAWSDPAGSYGPVLWGDTVIVAQDTGRIAAFEVDCRSDGGECEPLWRGKLRTDSEPVIADGVAYAVGHQVLAAYDVACGTGGDACDPLWTAVLPEAEGFFESAPLVSGGVVYARVYGFDPSLPDAESHPQSWRSWLIYAFPSDCGVGGTDSCKPLWKVELSVERWREMVAGLDRLYVVAVSNPNTPEESRRLLAFDSRCRTDGGECTPDWIAHTEGAPVVGEGLVFVLEGREVRAYASDCGTDGDTCDPIWRAPVPAGASRLVIDGDKLLVGSKDGGLTVFALNGEVTSDRGETG